MDVRRVVGYLQITLMLVMLAACSFLFPEKFGDFKPRSESIFGSSQSEVCKMSMSDADAEAEASDAVINDPEAQKLNDILSSLGLSLDLNSTSGCMVDEEVISDDGDGGGASAASTGVFGQQVTPDITYTTTPAGSNGNLHIVEGVNEENNLWLSWQQDSQNNQRRMITHIELFGDNSALDAALAQNMALGVRFTALEDYNKRRLVHQLAQFTTLGQGATYASAQSADGINHVESLQFGGQLLDVKNAQAVIVNEKVDPNNATQLYGEALIVLPLISNSRGGAGVNFELDDALYLRIPVVADSTEPLWNVAFVGSSLPDPLNEPSISTEIPIVNLPADDFGFQINPLSDGSGGWRTGRFQIYVKGHPDWTTDHDYHIVLGVHSGTGGTGTFSNVIHGTIGGTSTSNIITASGGIPHMEGTVQHEGVYYTVYVENAKGIKFELQMDIDGDGSKEKYGSLPVYFKETNGNYYDVTQMPGDNRKFGLRTSSNVHALPFTNMQLCAVDLTSCGTASVYVPDTGGTSTTVYDADILDYWSTPLVVPQDFDLTSNSINDVSRDNFYKNYTTERVDVLDIRAFSRWGYDFENAFDYCPYAYYDELMPFKRALCENYFEIWYLKQWEKENAILAATLNVHNAYVDKGIYDAILASSEISDIDVVFAGLDEKLDVSTFKGLMKDIKSFESSAIAASSFRAQHIDNIDPSIIQAIIDFYQMLPSVENLEAVIAEIDDTASFPDSNEDIYMALEDLFTNPNTNPDVLAFYDAMSILFFGVVIDRNHQLDEFQFLMEIMQGYWGNSLPFQAQSLSLEVQSDLEKMKHSMIAALGLFMGAIEAYREDLSGDISIPSSVDPILEAILDIYEAYFPEFDRDSQDVASVFPLRQLLADSISFAVLLSDEPGLSIEDTQKFSESMTKIFNGFTGDLMNLLPTTQDTICTINSPADPVLCQLEFTLVNALNLDSLMNWMASSTSSDPANPEFRFKQDRLQEGIGTLTVIANGYERGFDFWGIRHTDNFKNTIGSDENAEFFISDWWAATFRVPENFNHGDVDGDISTPDFITDESFFVVARGDDCGGDLSCDTVCPQGGPNCRRLKPHEIASWVDEAVKQFIRDEGPCGVTLVGDDPGCADQGAVVVAFTNGPPPDEELNEIIAAVEARSINYDIPVVIAWEQKKRGFPKIAFSCAPKSICDQLSDEELDLLACTFLNMSAGCTKEIYVGEDPTDSQIQVYSAFPPSPQEICQEFLDDCPNEGEFFSL